MTAASQLPTWVLCLQALLTPVIALIAIGIAFLSWRTSHLKVVVDLFDRRMEFYEGLLKIVAAVASTGSVSNESAIAFSHARHRAPFLFGPEVAAYLQDVQKALDEHHLSEMVVARSANKANVEEHAKRQARAFETISNFFVEMPKRIEPYVSMRQRRPWI